MTGKPAGVLPVGLIAALTPHGVRFEIVFGQVVHEFQYPGSRDVRDSVFPQNFALPP
jgi:hypothetical protein